MVERSVPVAFVSWCVALFVLGLTFLFSQLGGLLNRGRGGYVDFGDSVSYWPAHILSRLLFAVPTGLVVLIFGVHARAAVIVTIMTWFSLYVGWGVYFNIGVGDQGNYLTRAGVFDWLLGRQEIDWDFHQRFAREYAGMSLRGLVWTAPQGYALQQLGFGWEYSLSGSLMGLVYYLGKKTPVPDDDEDFNKVFGAGTAYAEWYWGVWIWFVLLVSCLSQVVRRVHVWIYNHNRYQFDFKPFSTWEIIKYGSLNRTGTQGMYEVFMFAVNLLFCCSVAFYALITQDDLRNKGQTFFGMFTAVLFLTFTQGWVWSLLRLRWHLHRLSRRSRPGVGRRYMGVVTGARRIGRGATSPQTLNTPGSPPANGGSSETQPLLAPSWPYGNGDHSVSPRMSERQRTLNLPEGNPPQGQEHTTPHVQLQVAPANTTTAFLIIWSSMEKWMAMDVFLWMRRLIGLVSILSTLLTMFMTVVATVWGWNTTRFPVAALLPLQNATNATLFR